MSHYIVKAEDLLAALDVRVDYDFRVKWDKQIEGAYKAAGPGDTKLALLGAICAIFPIFIPNPTGAANAKKDPKGSGAFVSKEAVPKDLHGFYKFVVANDTVKFYQYGEDKDNEEEDTLIWTGTGEQYGLDGTYRVFFQ